MDGLRWCGVQWIVFEWIVIRWAEWVGWIEWSDRLLSLSGLWDSLKDWLRWLNRLTESVGWLTERVEWSGCEAMDWIVIGLNAWRIVTGLIESITRRSFVLPTTDIASAPHALDNSSNASLTPVLMLAMHLPPRFLQRSLPPELLPVWYASRVTKRAIPTHYIRRTSRFRQTLQDGYVEDSIKERHYIQTEQYSHIIICSNIIQKTILTHTHI